MVQSAPAWSADCRMKLLGGGFVSPVKMSPGSVVMVSSPPLTEYALGLSRTIAFQRVLSSEEPSNWSSRLGPPGPPPPTGPSRNESNAASGAVAAWLLKANMPTLAFAGSGAGRPTGVQVAPSVEYAPVRFVPSDLSRRKKSSGKSDATLGVESGASLRGVPAFS